MLSFRYGLFLNKFILLNYCAEFLNSGSIILNGFNVSPSKNSLHHTNITHFKAIYQLLILKLQV